MAATIKVFTILLLVTLAFTNSKNSKHHRGLKRGNTHHSHHHLGFKSMQVASNKTLTVKPNAADLKKAEYIRLRMSPKHGHKIHRKNELGSRQNVTDKRNTISRKDNLAFHLASEGKFRDEKATKRFMDDGHHLDERPILGRCDINKQCKADQYCEGIYCFKCRKEDEHCYANGQCCKGMECQYGYCAAGVSAGMPGTYCDKAKDCKGSDACCILEMSVHHHNPICKPMLEEHETCGPINLFHQICSEFRAQNEPICGPCKQGLSCKSVGINGHHSVCLPEGAD